MHLRITKKKKTEKTIAPYFLIMKKFPFKCLDKMCIKQKNQMSKLCFIILI